VHHYLKETGRKYCYLYSIGSEQFRNIVAACAVLLLLIACLFTPVSSV